MPFCPNCRYEYRAGTGQCPDCGVALVDALPGAPGSAAGAAREAAEARFCPYCGQPRPPDAAFCVKCGKPLSEAPRVPQPPAAPQITASPTGTAPGPGMTALHVIGRTLVGLLALGAAVTAVTGLMDVVSAAARPLETSRPAYQGETANIVAGQVHTPYWSGRYGFETAVSLAMALAALLLLNRSLRRRNGRGPIDGLMIALSGRQGRAGRVTGIILPAAVLCFAGVCTVRYLTMPVHFYRDARQAAQHFLQDGVRGWELAQTGPYLFGEGRTGVVDVTILTPSLVREMRKTNPKQQIGGHGPYQFDPSEGYRSPAEPDPRREYQIPGVLPLALLLALCIWAVWAKGARRPAGGASFDEYGARALLGYGVLNLYVVIWLVSAQMDPLVPGGAVKGEWKTFMALFMFTAVPVLAVAYRKVESLALPFAARQGWFSLFFLVGVALPLGSYFTANAAKGSPAALWVFVYVGLSALYWLLARPRPVPQGGGNP